MHISQTARGLARVIAPAMVGGLLAACSPYVHADKELADYEGLVGICTQSAGSTPCAPQGNVTQAYFAALKFTRAQSKAYTDKMDDQAKLNSGTGLSLLVPTAILAFNLVKGVTADLNAGAAVAGTSIFVGSQFLYSAPRQRIYAVGAKALNCVVTAFGNVTSAEMLRDKLAAALVAHNTSIIALQRTIDDATARKASDDTAADADIAAAQTILDTAKAAQTNGMNALDFLDSAHARLNGAAQNVISAVTLELTTSEPSLSALGLVLGAAIPTSFGQFKAKGTLATGWAAPAARAAGGNAGGAAAPVRTPASSDALTAMKTTAKQLAESRDKMEIDHITGVLGTPPDTGALASCGADIVGSGLTLKASPDDKLAINAHADASGVINVNGGKLPYAAGWVGSPLPDNSKVTLNLSYGAGGAGIITISAKAGVKGAYQLHISDGSQGAGTIVNVEITDTAPAAPAPAASPAPDAQKTPSDPKVVEIQKDLRAILGAKITAPGDASGKQVEIPLNGDIKDPITVAAINTVCARYALSSDICNDLSTADKRTALAAELAKHLPPAPADATPATPAETPAAPAVTPAPPPAKAAAPTPPGTPPATPAPPAAKAPPPAAKQK